MTEPDMTADVETEDFIDELSDEALDREDGGGSRADLIRASSSVNICAHRH